MMPSEHRPVIVALLCLSAAALAGSLVLATDRAVRGPAEQPAIGARVKAVLTVDGLSFKDANGNGQLDPYEDWRLGAEARAADLVSRMTLDEKAGMMLIDSLNPAFGGAVAPPAEDYIRNQKMTRFIFRSVVTANPVDSEGRGGRGAPEGRGGRGAPEGRGGRGSLTGAQVTPEQAATWTNSIQELAESTRLGIPVLFKSNARNHYERSARFGINTEAGSFSEWPKEAGLAATRDMALIEDFARTMGQEWQAIGLRGMYGYMADLATEPRWYRVHECFTEDADLAAGIMKALVTQLQGGPVSPATRVALTIKHFPGGGPQELGLDPHFTFGKNQVYPAGRFADHLKPFRAAIDAGASAIMPYYGVPIDLSYQGIAFDRTGMAFSKQIVTDLLRGRLGFKGYVNSDTGIITARAWGLEQKTTAERIAAAVNGGTDVLSGFHNTREVLDLLKSGLLPEARADEAVRRLLKEQFLLGLFENPYVDAARAGAIVGRAEFRAKALDAQRRSIVLLQNAPLGTAPILPLPAPAPARPVTLYTMGLNAAVVGAPAYGGYTVVAGDYDPARGQSRPGAAGADFAIIRVEVTNPRAATSSYRSNDPATGANPAYINPATARTYGADDPAGLDDGLMFGGALPWEVGNLSFTKMAASTSWAISPSLADIQAVMKEVGPSRTVLCIYFRQPYVLDEESGLKRAGAILAGFGVSDGALMDVITGKFNPQGKLPFALARTLRAVLENAPDAPGYPADETLFPFGHGLGYGPRRPGQTASTASWRPAKAPHQGRTTRHPA
jgi:beta-glucosidase